MALSIKDPEADRLARQLAKQTKTTLTQAVINALRRQLDWEEKHKQADKDKMFEEMMAIAKRYASLPAYDHRSLEEMLYDENGLPK